MKRKIKFFFYKCFSKVIPLLFPCSKTIDRKICMIANAAFLFWWISKTRSFDNYVLKWRDTFLYFHFWKLKKWRHSELNRLTTRSKCTRMAIILLLKTSWIIEWNCSKVKLSNIFIQKNNNWNGIQFQVMKMLSKSSLR